MYVCAHMKDVCSWTCGDQEATLAVVLQKPLTMCSEFLCLTIYVFFCCAVFGRPCFLGVLHLLCLFYSLYHLVYQVPWSLWKNLMVISHIGLSVSRSLKLCIFSSCGSNLFPSAAEGRFSDGDFRKGAGSNLLSWKDGAFWSHSSDVEVLMMEWYSWNKFWESWLRRGGFLRDWLQ